MTFCIQLFVKMCYKGLQCSVLNKQCFKQPETLKGGLKHSKHCDKKMASR